jgi:hypothetical protein
VYYYFDIKLLNNEARFFYKKTNRHDLRKIANWKENISLIIKSKKSAPHLMKEEDFLKKLELDLVTNIKISKEEIKVFKNSDFLFYKIQSKEIIQMKFKSKEILFSKDFYINQKHVKYMILKI